MPKQPPPPLDINPPLINSSNPWASTLDDLRRLYSCPSTGAVTTRTSLITGFPHDDTKHQYIFLDPSTHSVSREPPPSSSSPSQTTPNASLNSLGYSPYTLPTYLSWIKTIAAESATTTSSSDETTNNNSNPPKTNKKGFIISVAGTPEEICAAYKLISQTQAELSSASTPLPLAMEINLSCPNIPHKPPPAYSKEALVEYLVALRRAVVDESEGGLPRVPVGLKTPPYTYATQFEGLVGALMEEACEEDDGGDGERQSVVSFLTATNTLGSCLAFSSASGEWSGGEMGSVFALPGLGVGGMAGAPLHPLALGNVATLRRMLDDGEERRRKVGHVRIVGIGGVSDADGYRRMRAVGASVVGVGTGLGLKGVEVFGEVERGLEGRW